MGTQSTKSSSKAATGTIPSYGIEEAYEFFHTAGAIESDDEIDEPWKLADILCRHARVTKSDLTTATSHKKAFEAIAYLIKHYEDKERQRRATDGEELREMLRETRDEVERTVKEEMREWREAMEGANEELKKMVEEVKEKVNAGVAAAAATAQKTHTYSAVVAAGLGTQQADPRLLARQGYKNRQLLLTLPSEGCRISREMSTPAIKLLVQDALTTIEQEAGPSSGEGGRKVRSVVFFTVKGTVMVELETDEAAEWLKKDGRADKMAAAMGAKVQARVYRVMAKFVPIIFDAKKGIETIAEENGIAREHITQVRWIKPEKRRRSEQECANLLVTFNDADIANDAITRGISIHNTYRATTKLKSEPTRCLKCHGWNHVAVECLKKVDVCGNCAEEGHRTSECDSTTRKCVSCKTAGHGSWDRNCPSFLKKCDDFDSKHPENALPYYPSTTSWSWLPTGKDIRQHPTRPPTRWNDLTPPPLTQKDSSQRARKDAVKTAYSARTEAKRREAEQAEKLIQKAIGGSSPTPSTNESNNGNPPPMNNTPPNSNNERLRILQINLNRSSDAQLGLIGDGELKPNWDVILVQEPHTTHYNHIRTPAGFRPVYPNDTIRREKKVRSAIWVNDYIQTNTWRALEILNTGDVSAIQIDTQLGPLTIFNVYNDCGHDDSISALHDFLTDNSEIISENGHMLWGGDFNRHHPMWDRDEDVRLFTNQALDDAQRLIDLLATWNMTMTLPKGTPTLQHLASKAYSRPDNVFCTQELANRIVKCDVLPDIRPAKTDHFPIATTLDVEKATISAEQTPNFKCASIDWEGLNAELTTRLANELVDAPILDDDDLQTELAMLTMVIQDLIEERIPKRKEMPYAKRWWTKELTKAKKEVNRLGRKAWKYRALPEHHAHRVFKDARNAYGDRIQAAKDAHWESFLENATEQDMWTSNRYIRDPVGDGGRPRIPTLKIPDGDGVRRINDNDEKAKILAKAFFPKPPETTNIPHNYEYPPPLQPALPITTERVHAQIKRLSPHKAPGLDGIPNLVLQKCADAISPHLARLFNATLDLGTYYQGWKDSITCVLRKPGKPSYEAPKAYRPIALLSTIGKLLSALVAEDITRLIETHDLIPATHFGGRPGRTTTDALHYLVDNVKRAWRKKKVVSVLYLDVEGAFPNAVTERVIHNLKRRRIPTPYVKMIEKMLEGRRTKLKFDDYTSDFMKINNGIGQGCPLSMVIYILYNADLLDIPKGNNEDAIGYVDDAILVATADNFEETTAILKDMMERRDGGLAWSSDHNSRFEMSKVAIMHFSRKTTNKEDGTRIKLHTTAPPLILRNTTIEQVDEYKYLGVLMDPELRWNKQVMRATAKATKWVLMYCRLTKPSTGVSMTLMRRLYTAVGIPKMTYAVDVWYTPPRKEAGAKKNSGSVKALKLMAKIQRMATLSITGALATMASDALDAHAELLPMKQRLEDACQRAYTRICTLPDSHILYNIAKRAYRTRENKAPNKTPIQQLAKRYRTNPDDMEKIHPRERPPTHQYTFDTLISNTREASMAAERADDAAIKIYTDGSGQDRKAGAAAVMYKEGQAEPTHTLRYHLGTMSEHSTYEAETVGLLLGVWLITIAAREETGQRKISIYTNNQSVVEAANKDIPGPAQYLRDKIVQMADGLRGRGPTSKKFTINWISAHSEVDGNEAVDAEAKKAAEGNSTLLLDLPYILRTGRKGLPKSKSAIRQQYKGDLQLEWTNNWLESPRCEKFRAIEEEFPFKSFRKNLANLSRHQSSTLIQIRTGHLPLNDYLYKRKLTETDLCQQC